MERKIIFTIIVAAAFVLMSVTALMFIGNRNIALCQPVDSEDSDGAMVTISGTVVYDNYEKGYILISWSRADLGEDGGFLGAAPVTLEKPGLFSIKVPKNVGDIHIGIDYYGSVNNISDIDSKAKVTASTDYGPIKIGSDNVELGDLQLEDEKSLMDDYKGPTVKIAGKVIVNNYDKGLIFIFVKDEKSFKGKITKVIAFKSLAVPEDYAIEVPQGAGNVYIYALNLTTDDPEKANGLMPGTRTGYYAENPLNIKSSDLDNVDIVIE